MEAIPPIPNGDGVAQVFYPNFVNRNIAVIRLALDVFHCLFQQVLGFNMTHGSEYVALDFFVAAVKLR